MKGVKGREFRKVKLNDSKRGGLLGHASVLTVTSNGIETSPVVRGVWILENILGTPPTPPPPDVMPLEPDIRGSKTIREQLASHRKIATCNECHRHIDPIGFCIGKLQSDRWVAGYLWERKAEGECFRCHGRWDSI